MKEQDMGLSLIVLLLATVLVSCTKQYIARDEAETFRNVIVLVPDGCGFAHMTAARWYKDAPLTQDSMEVSMVRTFSANSAITGSAAAATAFATGYKTWEDSDRTKCLSILPDEIIIPVRQKIAAGDQWRPAATVLEGARLAGKAVGLVATCYMSHATPAAFASHWHSRDDTGIIMEQMVYQGADVVFGGGFSYLIESDSMIPGSAQKGTRRDGENLYEVLLSRGYEVITTEDELLRLTSDKEKVWGMFAARHMVHDIDRRLFGPAQPSLAEMTRKAIEILGKDPDGFFLLVEASQVDWASHDNDLVGVVTDYLVFDNAVKVAVDFAKSQPTGRTLVLVFPDHDCGGLAMGDSGIDYLSFRPEKMLDVIKRTDLTADGIAMKLKTEGGGIDTERIKEIIERHCGIDDLTSEELKSIEGTLRDTANGYLNEIIGPILSRRAGVGWTTFGHTGNDVPMFSHGLERSPKVIDNTQIARLCAEGLGFELDEVTDRLFVDARHLFDGAAVTFDTSGVHKSMGQLVVERDRKRATFPFFKNIMIIEKDTVSLEGLTVYSLKADKVFLPAQARRLFEAF
ncbi:MAG: alkaline phosphatase [candidate division WOR-3 bacterium]|nr:MAG: alkaline phosphatase [candidate division WOR-3 bacterium]